MTPNQERNIQNDLKEAQNINERVDGFYEDHPRSRKSDNEIADEIIKKEAHSLFPYKEFSEPTREWLRSLSAAGIKILEDGFVETRRWDNTGENFGKPKQVLPRTDDIDAATRMQEHILESYIARHEDKENEDESTRLDSLEEVIEEAQKIFLDWKYAQPEQKEELKQKLADVMLSLERCRNEFKLKTKNQAQAVLPMKDSRGRDNPSALAARTVSVLNSLQDRLQEMHDIAPRVAFRKELLVIEKRRNESLCFKAGSKLKFVIRHVFFNKEAQTIKDSDVNGLLGKVRESKELLTEVVVSPYKARRDQALFFIASLEDMMKSKESMTDNKDTIKKILLDVVKILDTNVT
jgi:hypothetical protein